MNPKNSGILLFVNTFTITNHSKHPIEAEIWFNSHLPGKEKKSKNVRCVNTELSLSKPKVKLAYAEFSNKLLEKGVMVFRRIVPPQSSITSEEDGKFIFPPEGSFIVFLVSPNRRSTRAEVAFGWFEVEE